MTAELKEERYTVDTLSHPKKDTKSLYSHDVAKRATALGKFVSPFGAIISLFMVFHDVRLHNIPLTHSLLFRGPCIFLIMLWLLLFFFKRPIAVKVSRWMISLICFLLIYSILALTIYTQFHISYVMGIIIIIFINCLIIQSGKEFIITTVVPVILFYITTHLFFEPELLSIQMLNNVFGLLFTGLAITLIISKLRFERQRAEASLQRRNQELALLNQVSQMFNTSLEWNRVLDTVLNEICRLLNIVAASFWLRIPETGELVCQQATGPKSDTIIGWRLMPGEGLVGHTAQSGEILNIADAQSDARHYRKIDQQTGLTYHALLNIPFTIQETVIGVLSLMDTTIGRFGDDDLRLIQPIAAAAASAVENARLYLQVQQQKEAAEAANHKILESIRYAQLIQQSLLPNLPQVKQHLPESFCLWMPRDIVGGDFYQFYSTDDGFLLIVGDCTGHGVPGGFMTMLSVSALQRIIQGEHCYDPGEILARLNQIIKTSLHQDTDDAESDDGLDAAICLIRPQHRQMTFAGAKLPLYVLHDQNVTIIKGDRQSIGYKRSDADFQFTDHELELDPGAAYYVTTDGFVDQRGGKKGLSFGKKRFQALLQEQYGIPFKQQQENVLHAFYSYKGDSVRLDDVTVVGFSMSKLP